MVEVVSWISAREEELRAMLSDFHVDEYSSSSATEGFEAAVRFGRSIAAVQSMFARRVETGNGWQESGSRDAAEFLATRTGEDVRDVSRGIETAAALDSFPELNDAVLCGDLSLDRASAIARGGQLDATVVPELLNDALKPQSAKQFHRSVAEKLQGYHPVADQSTAHNKAVADRKATWWVNQQQQRFGLHMEGPLDDYARLRSMLEPEVERAFRRANKTDEVGTAGNHRYDALMTVLKSSKPKRRTRHDVLALVDKEALNRGHVEPGEVCKLVGAGPVPVSVVQEMVANGEARLVRVDEIALAKDLLRGYRHNRDITLDLVLQVIARDGGVCRRPGCDWAGRLHLEHRIPAARGGPPEIWNLYLICPPDHKKKSYNGFCIVGPLDGDVAWVKRRHTGDGGIGYPFNDDEDPAMYRR